MRTAEPKTHRDTGQGTFDGLNGKMIVVDGKVFRTAGDGSVEEVPDDETVPFSNVTFLDNDVYLNILFSCNLFRKSNKTHTL